MCAGSGEWGGGGGGIRMLGTTKEWLECWGVGELGCWRGMGGDGDTGVRGGGVGKMCGRGEGGLKWLFIAYDYTNMYRPTQCYSPYYQK